MAWNAEVLLSSEGEGTISLYCRTFGDSHEEALSSAEMVKSMLADGKVCYMRTPPEAQSDQDFDTKLWLHRGFVRFSFRNEPGETISPPKREGTQMRFVSLKDLSNGA